MEETAKETKTVHRDKKDECIKSLFRESGILHYRISSLSQEKLVNFIQTLLQNEDAQSAVSKFVSEINRQSSIILNPPVEITTPDLPVADPTAEQVRTKIYTPSGYMMVNEESVLPAFANSTNFAKPTNQPPANTFQPTLTGSLALTSDPQALLNQPATSVSSAERQAVITQLAPPPIPQNSASQMTTLAPVNPASTLLVQLPPTPAPDQSSPGAVPPASTPAPKPPNPTLEQMRTTFTVSANGKANVNFVGQIEGKSSSGKPVVIIDVTVPPEIGLTFNKETSELIGVPLVAGEFKLTVHFQFENHEPGKPTPDGECNLIINADPKTLWKNLPSDNTDEYWKKDEDLSSIVGKDGLDIIVASKRGRSHAHAGTCRDDDFCLMQDEDSGWRVITVADGAGSAKKSRQGSLIASRTATESVMKAISSERGKKLDEAIKLRETDSSSAQKAIRDELYYLFGHAATEAVHAIDAESKLKGAAYKDYSTTLIITIHKKIAVGHFVAAYWVGDGGVGIYRKGQEVKVLGKADSGEFAGQTRFLDAAMLAPQEISNRIDAKIVADFTSIIAMTDGITDPWFETDANFESLSKWDELWANLSTVFATNPPASGLLNWLDFWSPGNHDDRTIAILYPAEFAIPVTLEAGA
ncbi:MAG: protein phosphatase 2C domain-containing protein [Desulfuromonadaceae bacterium]